MNGRLRVLSTLGVLAIVVGACSSGATPSPSSSTAAGATSRQPARRRQHGAGGRLKGALTVWASYGSGAGSEPTAFKTLTDKISAANPDLKLTIQDVKFDDLFKKFELEAASGGGPDLFIAPNDSLGKEARAGLFLDLTSQLGGKLTNDSQVSIDGQQGRWQAVHGPRVPQGRGDVLRQVQDRDPAGDHRRAPCGRQGWLDQGGVRCPLLVPLVRLVGPHSAVS